MSPPSAPHLTGGETAYSVCRALGADGIALAGEVEPGLAIGTLLGGPFAGLAVITKAGGFGDPETLGARRARVALGVRPLARGADATGAADTVEVLDLGNADPAAFALGRVSALCGRA